MGGPGTSIVDDALRLLNSEIALQSPDAAIVDRKVGILVEQLDTAFTGSNTNVVASIITGCSDRALIEVSKKFDAEHSSGGTLINRVTTIAAAKQKFDKTGAVQRVEKAMQARAGSSVPPVASHPLPATPPAPVFASLSVPAAS